MHILINTQQNNTSYIDCLSILPHFSNLLTKIHTYFSETIHKFYLLIELQHIQNVDHIY